MIDYILAAMSAGLIAFLAFFSISFIALGLVAGAAHLLGLSRQTGFAERPTMGREQTA